MYHTSEAALHTDQAIGFPQFNRFELKDRRLIQTYIDIFKPQSCEYNFSNLFAWQDAYQLFWTIYQERLLIYDAVSQSAFMPLGEDFYPEELVILSLNLKTRGLTPDFSLVTPEYLKKFPEIETYYQVKKERDYSEYIYDIDSLCSLTGTKLHKKRNLISQFKRSWPDVEVHPLTDGYREKALELARELMDRRKQQSKTLDREMDAIKISFKHFDQLGLEGLVLTLEGRVLAFSVFSPLCHSTFDIQFEKSDTNFKGIAQVINHETAKYLKGRGRYLNREQDLGIKGLRQAKMSYDPAKLITPAGLVFTPPN